MNTDKEQIKKNIQNLIDGITGKDWEKAGQYYADDYLLFESGLKMTWPEQKKMFREHIGDHEIDVSFINLNVSKDGSMAWCLLNENTDYTMGGEEVHQNTLVTTVWEKKDGKWKLVHFNRSVNPLEIPEAQKKALEEAV